MNGFRKKYWFRNPRKALYAINNSYVNDLIIDGKKVENFFNCIEIYPIKKLKDKNWTFKDDIITFKTVDDMEVYYWIGGSQSPILGLQRMIKSNKVVIDFSEDEYWPTVKVWTK